MKNRWGRGEPVNLSDLLRITPVADEIMHISEELGMSLTDVMWIVSQIIENQDEIDREQDPESMQGPSGQEWDNIDLESVEEEMGQAMYMVNVKINGPGRFPEIGFKAGVNDTEDMSYFFDMILEMMEKLE
ncbi:MAG: hypothetical protein GX133_04630 [Syntrophomonadaceae bacterium]|nr:hypothetical protein [Syntrophomonadaceae bacterium]